MRFSLPLILITILLLTTSCSTLRDAADIREPNVEFSKMSIQSISFDGVTLLFDFDITNPNRMGVSAEGYNYEFFINENSFLSGVQDQRLSIGAESNSVVQVPVSMKFSELYQTFESLVRQDSLSYMLSTEVEFDLPVMGSRKVPVQTSGNLPIPRIPRINFDGFDIKNISLSGADVEVSFRISNPNLFKIGLQSVSYILDVNGRNWLDTVLEESVEVSGGENKLVTLPIRLNASQMGSAMMDIMAGRKEFDYKLRGSASVSADIEGFEDGETLPFDLEGTYKID